MKVGKMIYVLFSSGIDSLACLVWAVGKWGWGKVMPIYVRVGSVYEEKEMKAANEILTRMNAPYAIVVAMPGLTEDRTTAHVPFRNLSLILNVAKYEDCEGVVFGMLLGEAPEDKNPRFVKRLETLIQSQLAGNVYQRRRAFKIYTPFRWCTKRGVVNWLINSGCRELLLMAISCHSGTVGPCGRCIPCFTRWAAMLANGLTSNYAEHPAEWMLVQLRQRLHGYRVGGVKLMSLFSMATPYSVLTAYTKRVHGLGLLRFLLGTREV